MGDYVVRCVGCGSVRPPYPLVCPEDGALLRAEYALKRLSPRSLPGIWRFYDWLPVHDIIREAGEGSVTYRSSALSRELGLKNLYISFSGYWPERDALMKTCSFKDLEAPPTMQRLRERCDSPTLVVASAGNTARAFANVASMTGQDLVLVVPESGLSRLWTTVPRGRISLICVRGDYYDAIQIGERMASMPGFVGEGGARNIARRDGMATVMLEAALAIERLPDHYFQAVGSGTGGISAWEASLRLVDDGRFGKVLPRLHLAQNLPNAPIYHEWHGIKAEACPSEDMFDDVLFNRHPPYGVAGGVRDALTDSGGDVYGISNREAADAKRLFEGAEGIDILNAPAVAVAALANAIESGVIMSDETILLNITGGGVSRLKEELMPEALRPDIIVSSSEEAIDFLAGRS